MAFLPDCDTQVWSGQVATSPSRGKMMLLPASLRPLVTGVPIHEEPVREHFRREPVDRFKTSAQENEEN